MAINPLIGIKIIYILGITNVLSLLLVLLSCRCMLGVNIFGKLWQKEWYKKFYGYHCYYWWLFVISVLTHTTMAFFTFGNPFF